MSITDIATGRMRPARPFGQRRSAPVPARPLVPQPPSPFLQACRAHLHGLKSRPRALWQQIPFGLAYLRALTELRGRALPRFPDLAPLIRRGFAATLRLTRRELTFLARALRQTFSLRAIARALLLSEFSTTLVRLAAYLGCLAMLAIMADHIGRALPVAERSDAPPPPEWTQVTKPFPAFFITMPELGESGGDYILRRHTAGGGGRRDILSFGELKGTAPHLMVEVYRPLAEFAAFDEPGREIAARLAEAGADAGPIRTAGEMETKFGTVALVEFSLAQPQRQCLGFVHASQEPPLQILGWHCISGAALAERDVPACALDRLSLISAGSDPKLREFFARAELKRNFCGQRSHILTPTPRLGPASPPRPEIKRGRLAAG